MNEEETHSPLNQSQRAPGDRRSTRSQAAPNWTATDELLLVNEIAAVEADCLKAFSSFQKWKTIAQNCSALGVPRSLNQYRRKWDALRAEHERIKQWEARARASGSYWGLEIERRRLNGLPESFDLELFKVIDDLMRAREGQSDTDPDSDPEAEAEGDDDDVAGVVAEPESKRRRRRSTPRKSCPKENSFRSSKVEKPQETHAEEKPVGRCLEVVPQKSLAEEKPQKSCVKKKHNNSQIKERAISIEEQEKFMTIKLHENAELIRSIVTENADHDAADVKSTGDLQTDFVRCQGDRVIACLGDIVKTLDQLRHLVQECD